MSGYLGDNCWQRPGCWCRRCWAHGIAAISSVPWRSCFLRVEIEVYLLYLLLQPRPLPGLHTQAGSLSCREAAWSLCLTDSSYRWTSQTGRNHENVWISPHSRSPPRSYLLNRQANKYIFIKPYSGQKDIHRNGFTSTFSFYLDPLVPCVFLVSGCCAPLGWRFYQSSPFLKMDWNAAGKGETTCWSGACHDTIHMHEGQYFLVCVPTSASTISSRLYLLIMAWVLFSTWVATSSNSSSTANNKKHKTQFA